MRPPSAGAKTNQRPLGVADSPASFLLPILMALACCASGHWPRQPAHDLRHLFDGAFGRAPVGSVRARVALRPACPFARAFSARAIASSMSFSAPVTSSHLTIVTHLPFSKSL